MRTLAGTSAKRLVAGVILAAVVLNLGAMGVAGTHDMPGAFPVFSHFALPGIDLMACEGVRANPFIWISMRTPAECFDQPAWWLHRLW
ncbi:MAG: hypothetical protein AAFV62_02355 [Pseudomonadota bacterium]